MSYSNYSTYLKYKNCCRPIGDTGPPGAIGPTGPSGTFDVSGNKGEILYFSEDNTLDNTTTIFITNGNVTINNNLVVTGNLSMDDNFINDVSGIYFSDGTYIGHGSSFDITTSERLDISASGDISVTGNLTLNDATTFNKTLNVVGNTTLQNLFVNGSINNLIEISGNTIQPIISDYVNLGYDELGSSNDKRFNLGFFNKIKSRTAVIVGNLTMDNNFINDVSGIYFSDGTYIGHGSSFDITTSERLDISASGGISVTGDLTINDATTFNKTLNVVGNINSNTIHTQRLLFPGGNYIDYEEVIGELYVNGNTTLAHRVQLFSTLDVSGATTIRSSLDVSGNLSMNKNSIKNVDAIYFSENGSSSEIYIDYDFNEFKIKSQGSARFTSEDLNATLHSDIDIAILNNNSLRFNNENTYITSNTANDKLSLYGNSIFMQAGVNGDFIFTGNSNNVDLNFLTHSASGFTINYKDSDDKLRFNVNDLVIDKTNNYIGIQTDSPSATLEVNGNAIINGNLSMDNNFIHDVSGIYFTRGNLLFSDFSSVKQSVQLPSSQGQPISLERKTLFYDPNFNLNTEGIPKDISFVAPTFNQMKLNISGTGNTIISPSPDISGQYVEIYANFLVNSSNSNSKTIALDISGVSSGSSFKETIDVRSISKQGNYYITFGPHIFAPEQWSDTSHFVITANTTDLFTIEQYKLMFKSYFM